MGRDARWVGGGDSAPRGPASCSSVLSGMKGGEKRTIVIGLTEPLILWTVLKHTTYEFRREVKELAQLTQGSQAERREECDKGDWRRRKRVRRRPPEGSAAVLNGHWSTALSGLTTTSLAFCIPLGTGSPVLLPRVHSRDRSAC